MIISVYKSIDINSNKFMDIDIIELNKFGSKRITFPDRELLDSEFSRIVELLTK